jgi:hypothetical protein
MFTRTTEIHTRIRKTNSNLIRTIIPPSPGVHVQAFGPGQYSENQVRRCDGLRAIGSVVLSFDEAKARDFYCALLGFEVLFGLVSNRNFCCSSQEDAPLVGALQQRLRPDGRREWIGAGR